MYSNSFNIKGVRYTLIRSTPHSPITANENAISKSPFPSNQGLVKTNMKKMTKFPLYLGLTSLNQEKGDSLTNMSVFFMDSL